MATTAQWVHPLTNTRKNTVISPTPQAAEAQQVDRTQGAEKSAAQTKLQHQTVAQIIIVKTYP